MSLLRRFGRSASLATGLIPLLAAPAWAAPATGESSAPAGGAPLGQVIGATAAGLLLTAALLVIGLRYRENRMALLDLAALPFTRLLRVPAWAALPVALGTASLILAGTGFYWDVAVHIDRGRDPGPFGTPAHFPILIGLFGIFASGWLALVMARGQDASRTGIRLTETWTVPTSGLVMMACGSFGLLGFPLDDVWHSIFGQDVTLWGPTHLILLTGGQLMIPTILGLLLEGRAATGTRRADTGDPVHPGRLGRWGARLIVLSGAGGVLAGLTIYQGEFGFGVPQYNLLFQPTLLAFAGTLALVFGRAVGGRGGALGAAGFNIIVSGAFALVVGPGFGEATPHFSSYLPAALCVEAAALIVSPRRLWVFAGTSALLVGTFGTLGEWAWTHVWMPIPWTTRFVPGALGVAVVAAGCGALVGAFVAAALAPGRLSLSGSRRWMAGVAGTAGFAIVMAFCLPTHAPGRTSATVALDRSPSSGSSLATVSFHPASLTAHADYVQQLSWQGHTKSIVAIMRRISPGVYRTVQPLPLSGTWKSLIRFEQGRNRGDLPVYMPADGAIPVAGIRAEPHVTRALVTDTQLMQRERKRGIASWIWSAATISVLVIITALLIIMGWGLNRVAARLAGEPPSSVALRARSRLRGRRRPGVRIASARAGR